MNNRGLFFILIITVLLCSACAAKEPDFDIRGNWTYIMTSTDGNTYDNGTITFSGEPTQGTYHQLNVYQVEYEGEFSVDGANLILAGDESWNGMIVDANNLSGTWNHTDSVSGTFTAIRK